MLKTRKDYDILKPVHHCRFLIALHLAQIMLEGLSIILLLFNYKL